MSAETINRLAAVALLAACTTSVAVDSQPGSVGIRSEAGWCGAEVTVTPTQVVTVEKIKVVRVPIMIPLPFVFERKRQLAERPE